MSSHPPAFRLGIIGTGGVAALHVDAARATPGVELAALCDIQAESAQRMAADAGAAAYTSHREMLARQRLDGVVITSPHALHAEMTLAAAEAGVHVLVEKPMATTIADCTAMIDACAAAGVVLAVGHVVRFGHDGEQARQAVDAGRLGRVLAISHQRTAHYTPGSRPDWFFDPVMAGGGIVMNVGTHGLDRIQWLGGGQAETVTAHTWRRGGHAIETDAIGVIGLAGGVQASFLLTSAGLPYTDETVVVCEDGVLRWSSADGVRISRPGTAETRLGTGERDLKAAFAAQLADFTAACRDRRPPRVTGEYGRSIVATVLAVYESARHGRPAQVVTGLVGTGA